jgi:hypothetical protein
MNTDEKILMIENDTSWRNQFKKILCAIGEDREIKMLDFYDFDAQYKTSQDFNNIGCCFIDLELGAGLGQKLSDTWGKDKVLSHIRKIASWIPVACITRYISGNPLIVCDLSVSDFDGFYPKEVIAIMDENADGGFKTHPEFNQVRWKGILNDLRIKRVASSTGRTLTETKALLNNAGNINLTLSEIVKKDVEKYGIEKFKEGLSLMGLGGNDISVDEIISGFSGMLVAKVNAYGNDNKGAIRSYWLLKWGAQVCKLAEESEAHKRMFQRGIERSLQIPQLHPNVIYWKGLGYIAYGFEKDAKTALELIYNKGTESIISHIEKIAAHIYSNSTKVPISPREQLLKWCKLDDNNHNIFTDTLLQHPLEVSGTLIHGDFHLRNILIKIPEK